MTLTAPLKNVKCGLMEHLLKSLFKTNSKFNLGSIINKYFVYKSKFAYVVFSRMLADYGVCCSTPSWLGETPLHAAAQFAQTHVIQFLLNQGVQVYRVALIKPELGTFE